MGLGRLNAEQILAQHFERVGSPAIAVNQARRALLPKRAALQARPVSADQHQRAEPITLKSFDFVLYGDTTHLLLEVKGRSANFRSASGTTPSAAGRMECWVTLGDIESLDLWQRLFGPPFRAAIGFVYEMTSDADPGPMSRVFEVNGRRYGLACILADDYRSRMKSRSVRWKTVDLPQDALGDLIIPLPAPAAVPSALVGVGEPATAKGLDDPEALAARVWAAATGEPIPTSATGEPVGTS